MPRAILLSVTLCTALLLPSLSVAKEVYVATTGDDANPGTKEKPLASVAKAAEAMRGAGGGTIWIGPGEYFLPEGIALNSKHSGTTDAPLVVRATEPRAAKLSGACSVGDFKPIEAKEAAALISEEARRHVLVSDLKAQGFASLAQLPDQFRAHGREELIFDDRPMQAARWPNEGFAVFTEVIDAGASKPTHWVERDVYRPGSFRFPGDRAQQWDFSRGVYLHGFWCYDWCDEVLKAASYDKATGELRLAVKHAYGIGSPWKKDSKRRFYAINVFEELDAPGEYYLDRQQQRLYFWPPGDVTKKSVRLTVCRKPIVAADGAANLLLRDLTIEGGCDLGISLRGGRNCRVENCLVRNTGAGGISASGADMAVVGCEVTGTAAYGISANGGDRKSLTPGNCLVAGCHVHDVGRLDWMRGRGITLGGCGNRVANNLIHHCPTGAVSYGGNEHLLELNEVHDVCIYYSDVGVFYTGRDWSSRGNVVRWNHIHDVTNNEGHGSSGIYLDDCDSGDTVVGNIVCGGVGRGVLLGGGRDNTIRGNIFVDLPVGIHVDARGPRGITLDRPGSWNLLEKCKQVDYLSPLWRERYPRLARVMDEEPLLPMGNVIHGNILAGCTKPFGLSRDVKPEWLDRADNLECSTDDVPWLPGDATPRKLDLAKLSTLWKKVPNFEPIPVEKIGLKGLR